MYNPVKNKIVRATAVTFDENKRYSLGESKEPRQKGCSSEETVFSDNAITTEEEEEKETEGYTGYRRSSTALAIARQLGQPSERSQAITVEAHRYDDQSNDHVRENSSSGECTLGDPSASNTQNRHQNDSGTRKSNRASKGKAASHFDEEVWLATEHVYEPATYQEAITDPDYSVEWKNTINAELQSLK